MRTSLALNARAGSRGASALGAVQAVVLLVILFAVLSAETVSATAWQVEFELTNGSGDLDTVRFGVDPSATPDVDPLLGEVCLPPWPPSDLFDVRFMIPGCNGLELDLRDTTHVEREHLLRWQAGAGGYPVVVRWDRQTLPFASLEILDGYGGVFIPPLNMFQTDSLTIPTELEFVSRLTIRVTPGVNPNADPVLSPLPDGRVFSGQQFPEYRLDDYVFDPDTPDSLLSWFVTGNEPLVFDIDGERILRVFYPTGWLGSRTVEFTVFDPQGNSASTEASYLVDPGGVPLWEVPFQLTNGADETKNLVFAMHPEASDDIDTDLGEVALPPWPPSDLFDARMRLPDGFTYSIRDVRRSTSDEVEYTVRWQAGQGGYPITMEWSSALPPGSFTIEDEAGGVFIPPFSMRDSSSVTVPPELSFLQGLRIRVAAAVDSIPPLGPMQCEIIEEDPGTSITISWDPCVEVNFAYYELFLSDHYFETPEEAGRVWDYSEDSGLTSISTTTTTIPWSFSQGARYVRVRAWDDFGNVGLLSQIPSSGAPAPAMRGGRLLVTPNPVRTAAVLAWNGLPAGGARIEIVDVQGRRMRTLVVPRDGGTSLRWDGRDEVGERLAAGVYFAHLRGGGQAANVQFLVLR